MKKYSDKKIGSFSMGKGSMPVNAGSASGAKGPSKPMGKGVVAMNRKAPRSK